MATNLQPNSKYIAHILECAEIAEQVAVKIGLRDDAAKQACFATICIDAKNHGVFLEPTPNHTKESVKAQVDKLRTDTDPKFAPEMGAIADSLDSLVDEAAAQKADAQIKDVPQHSTPEQDASARRTAFLKGIDDARNLLNKEGHVPPITPAGLNAYIKKEFPPTTNLGSLDLDQLEELTKKLSVKLDALRGKKKTQTPADDDIGF